MMRKTKYSYRIQVVDDGSQDRTALVAKNANAYVYKNARNLGLAETFKKEMEHALEHHTDVIVHTDADGQYPAKYIPLLVKKVVDGNDLVLGSRFGRGRYAGPLTKSLGNRAFAFIFSGLLNQRISDTTTGFRAFTPEVAQLPLINSFTYTQEQLIRAGKQKMKLAEVPIHTHKTRDSRLFSNPLQYAFRAWTNIFRIYRDFAPLKFFGFLGAMFLVIGIVLGTFIAFNVITTGQTGGIPRVILSALLILTGIQIILFGFLADMKQ